MLGTRDKDDSLVAMQLTVDLKPNLPGFFLSLPPSPLLYLSVLFDSFSFIKHYSDNSQKTKKKRRKETEIGKQYSSFSKTRVSFC